MSDTKPTGGMFAAIRRLRRDNQRDNAHLHAMLDSFEGDIRSDVQATHSAVDRIYDHVKPYTAAEYKLNKLATVLGCSLLGGIFGAIGFTGYEAWTAKQQLINTSRQITQFRSDLTDGTAPDIMGKNGLPARIECIQVTDGKGGIDIRFSASRTPVPGSPNGSITTSKGMLRADGVIEGKTVTSDGTELPDWPLRPMADLCSRALNLVPGVAG